jgi:hypothetical protein
LEESIDLSFLLSFLLLSLVLREIMAAGNDEERGFGFGKERSSKGRNSEIVSVEMKWLGCATKIRNS